MNNFLPNLEKKELRKEYLLRLVIVACGGISVVVFSTIIFLLPAYIGSNALKVQVQQAFNTIVQKGVTIETQETEAKVKSLNELLNRFADGLQRPKPSQTLQFIESIRVPGISLSTVEFTYSASSTMDIKIIGEAVTRDALIAYKKKIENSGVAQKIDLPVSDLAKSKDIAFTIKITTK